MNSQDPVFEYLALIAEHVPANFYCIDIKSRFAVLNERTLTGIGGKSKEDIIGKNVYELYRNKDIADEIQKDFNKVIATGIPSLVEDKIADVTTGKIRYFSATRAALRNKKGDIVGIVGTSIEITAEKEAEQLKIEKAEHEARAKEQADFRETVGKAVHDLKSIYASWENAVKRLKYLPEDERVDMNNMRERAEAIADQLRNRYKNPGAEDERRQPLLVASALYEVINERKLQHQDTNVTFDVNFDADTKFVFIKIEPSKFKRAISNLINNAVEAVKDKTDGKGRVEITLEMIGKDKVTIDITDNGKGIPVDTLAKLNAGIRVTEGKKNGEGHGVLQAREAIIKNGGSIRIESSLGVNTLVFLAFPKISNPSWIGSEIKLVKGDTIIIVDDEPSIHKEWDKRLKPILEKVPTIKMHHFTNGKKALQFINKLSVSEKLKTCLLSDYQLRNQPLNGIDIIREAKIKRSVLVTSQQLTPTLKKEVTSSKAKMLPKNLVEAVNIVVNKKLKPASRIVDFVWLDDNRHYVEAEIKKYYKNLKVDIYDNPFEFLDDVFQYPQNTKLVFDNQYYHDNGEGDAYGITGTQVAQQLHEKGYTRLFMVSGEKVLNQKDYYTLILKSDEMAKNLDKL